MPSVAEYAPRASKINGSRCVPSVAECAPARGVVTHGEYACRVYISANSAIGRANSAPNSARSLSILMTLRCKKAGVRDLAEFAPRNCRVFAEFASTVHCINSARVFAAQMPVDLEKQSFAECMTPPRVTETWLIFHRRVAMSDLSTTLSHSGRDQPGNSAKLGHDQSPITRSDTSQKGNDAHA